MNKFIIGAIVLVIVLIFGARLIGNETSSQQYSQNVTSAISVVEEPYNFGEIDIFAGKVSTTYTLKNDGAEAVTITSAATSCMCTEGQIAGLSFGMHGSDVGSVVIQPGGEEKVTAIYDPLAHGPNGTGPVTRELMLETDSSETPKIRLKFSANVIKN